MAVLKTFTKVLPCVRLKVPAIVPLSKSKAKGMPIPGIGGPEGTVGDGIDMGAQGAINYLYIRLFRFPRKIRF
jgi:hypothetical protein